MQITKDMLDRVIAVSSYIGLVVLFLLPAVQL